MTFQNKAVPSMHFFKEGKDFNNDHFDVICK